MLSGESAQGKYPVQSVSMMQRIVNQSEAWARSVDNVTPSIQAKPGCEGLYESLASAAVDASINLKAACIIVHSMSGATAKDVAKYRPQVPIIAFCHTPKVGRMLQIYRGIHPVVLPAKEEAEVADEPSATNSLALEIERSMALGFCKPGDTVVVLASEKGKEGSLLGNTVAMRVVQIKK